MFSLNMLDYPMLFLSLSTWTWNNFPTLRSNLAFYLNPVLPPRPSKSYWVVGTASCIVVQPATPMFSLSLDWTWDTFLTLRGTQGFYRNHVPLKVIGWMAQPAI